MYSAVPLFACGCSHFPSLERVATRSSLKTDPNNHKPGLAS